MSQTYPIRPVSPADYEALIEVDAHAFLEPWHAQMQLRERTIVEFDRTFAARDGDQMVGIGGIHSFRLAVPGGTAPAAGITRIAVLPSHRRRGILTAMMSHLFSDASRRSEPLAILFASESGIYGRFGFGLASMDLDLRIRRGEGRLSSGPVPAGRPGPVRLRPAEPLAARAELGHVFETVFARQPGMVARDERWWTYLLTDPAALRPAGSSPLRCLLAADEHGPRGYVLYRTKSGWDSDHLAEGRLEVRELYAIDPAATAALWSDLLSRDLVGEVHGRMRPVDEPLLAMLADPRRARPALIDGLWLRLVDLPAAMTARTYSAAADLVIDVTDPVLPGNDGRWRLRAAGPGSGGTACERTGEPAHVQISVQALAAGYLGRACLSQLAGAGQVAELTPGALAMLGTALAWDRPPYSGMMF